MSNIYDPLAEDEYEELSGEFILDLEKPVVLLMGWVEHEGILSSLKSTGHQYKRKMLDSSPDNWDSISDLFDTFHVAAVLAKFSAKVFDLFVLPEYSKVRKRLFRQLASVPHQIYIHENILQNEQAEGVQAEHAPYSTERGVSDSPFEFLRSNHLEVIPYKTNAEITVLAVSFLNELNRNLIFRMYVPSGRLWSSEADKFLQLFRDYIAKVDHLTVRLDQKRTDFGTIYEFHGERPPKAENLASEFQEFSEFMDLCALDSDAARNLLESKNIHAREVTEILEKYAKEARRLQLDIKHDAENKLISIRHRLESELIDLNPSPEDIHAIAQLVKYTIPDLQGGLPSPSHSFCGLPAPLLPTRASVTYNIRPQFINTVNGVIAEEICGNQHFDPQHHHLLELVRIHGGAETKQLETAVYEIADKGVDHVDRLKATRRLKAFLLAAGKKSSDMAFSLLQKYIEGQIGI